MQLSTYTRENLYAVYELARRSPGQMHNYYRVNLLATVKLFTPPRNVAASALKSAVVTRRKQRGA